MSDLATAAPSAASRLAVPVVLVLRSARSRRRDAHSASRARPATSATSSWCPNVGDYYALPARNDAQALVRNAERHRAPVERLPPPPGDDAQGPRQRAEHRLPAPSLDLRPQGRAPRRAALRRTSPASNLARTPLQNWNGLLFDGPRDVARDLAGARRRSDVRLLGLRARPRRDCTSATTTGRRSSRSTSRTTTSARSIRGSASSSPATTCSWEFGDWYFGADGRRQQRAREARARKTYERWHKAVLDFYRGEIPPHGAIWLTYYPNIMVEWYPHVLVISTLLPRGRRTARSTSSSSTIPRRSRCSSASSSRPSRRRTWRPRSRTTRSPSAWTPAARRCTTQGRSEVGPYQSPMEDGMQHFHEFYRREMEARASALSGARPTRCTTHARLDRRARDAASATRTCVVSTSATT